MARILIAEDDPLSQRFVSTVLERMGHSPFISPNGRHAWETLNADTNFQLLITDVMMPGMDGTTLIRTLRSDERFTALPIIIMSAFIGITDISHLLDIGASWFMAKPVEIAVLEDYVNRALK